MSARRLVPDGFVPPLPADTADFAFEVLGPEHNEADLAAWSRSVEHIHATPGWRPDGWPDRVYTLEENLADLTEHREHHVTGLDFAWTVLDPVDRGAVIGCVYVKPDRSGATDAEVRSWVVVDRAELDTVLRAHIRDWVEREWPFASFAYAG